MKEHEEVTASSKRLPINLGTLFLVIVFSGVVAGLFIGIIWKIARWVVAL